MLYESRSVFLLPCCLPTIYEFHTSTECVGVITSGLPFSTAISDIWSLGIILINMVTGRNPWHIASPAQDEGFRQFLQEGAPYLQRSLPISKDAARLFVSVLEPDPATRITIPQLRKSVKEIPSFYRTPGDHHPSLTSLSKPSSLPHNEESRWYNCALTSATMFEVSFHAHQPSPSTASIVAIAPSTVPEFSTITNQSSSSTDVDLDDFPVPPPLTPGGNSGSHSDADSEGPATPVTRVHEPEVQVPDDFVLGGVNEDPNIKVVKQVVRPGGLQKQSLRKLWTSISPPPRFSRPVQKFVDAVQRVKVLGS